MSVDPASLQQDEEKFRRSLVRFGWMQPLLTFVGLFSLGLLLLYFSQTPEVDAQFPAGFLLGLASGFMSTAVIFYFYEYAFTRRMEKRAYFARLSGTRRRTGALAVRKQSLTDRQNALLSKVKELAPDGLPAYTPQTRAQASEILALADGLVGTLIEWNAIDEELAAALRDNVQIEAEEGEQAPLSTALDNLIAFNMQGQQRGQLHADMQTQIVRLNALLADLPDLFPRQAPP